MKAVLFRGKGLPLSIENVNTPRPIKDQVLVKLKYAALNHRDIWVTTEQSMNMPNGVILGSDGCGIIQDVGEEADPLLVGAEVVINPSLEWGNNPVVNGDSFKILGFPDNGTFAEYIVVSKKYIFEKPEHLSFEESAAVPLAGLTAYRALFSKARLRAKEKILITGIGGGVALWLLQFAVAYQARAYVTSGSSAKIERAKELGALGGVNYNDADWATRLQKEAGGFDIILDSAGGSNFSKFIELAMPGGRIVNFGRTAGDITGLSTKQLYSKQLSIHGTTMGTRDEFLSMLDFLEGRQLRPIVDSVFPLENVADAFKRMDDADHFGKILLQIAK